MQKQSLIITSLIVSICLNISLIVCTKTYTQHIQSTTASEIAQYKKIITNIKNTAQKNSTDTVTPDRTPSKEQQNETVQTYIDTLSSVIDELKVTVLTQPVPYTYSAHGAIFFVDAEKNKHIITQPTFTMETPVNNTSYKNPILSPDKKFIAMDMFAWEMSFLKVVDIQTNTTYRATVQKEAGSEQTPLYDTGKKVWLPDGRLEMHTEQNDFAGLPGGKFRSISSARPWEMMEITPDTLF